MIVLSSDQAIKDLLDKRSAIYSDRLDMYIGQELCSGNLRISMLVDQDNPLARNDLQYADLVSSDMVQLGEW